MWRENRFKRRLPYIKNQKCPGMKVSKYSSSSKFINVLQTVNNHWRLYRCCGKSGYFILSLMVAFFKTRVTFILDDKTFPNGYQSVKGSGFDIAEKHGNKRWTLGATYIKTKFYYNKRSIRFILSPIQGLKLFGRNHKIRKKHFCCWYLNCYARWAWCAAAYYEPNMKS